MAKKRSNGNHPRRVGDGAPELEAGSKGTPRRASTASDRQKESLIGAKKKARARRRFILEELRRSGTVSVDEIKRRGREGEEKFPASTQSLSDDLQEFKDLGLPVARQDSTGDFYSTLPQVRFWTYKQRAEEYEKQKMAIGRLGTEILWGNVEGLSDDKFSAPLLATVIKILNDPLKYYKERYKELYKGRGPVSDEAMKTADWVKQFLLDYWKKRHRQAALDSGTTTEKIASVLASEKSDITTRHSTLRIVTNSPTIEKILEPPRTPVEVVGVGGALRKDTSARTGYLAELCLNAWQLRGDISMIGATSLHFAEGNRSPVAFACDSEDEARTKSTFLDFARLKCIVMDSSKFIKWTSSSFSFCPVDPIRVHLVITDSHVFNDEKGSDCFDRLWRRGVVVLTAEVPES